MKKESWEEVEILRRAQELLNVLECYQGGSSLAVSACEFVRSVLTVFISIMEEVIRE